MSKKDDDIDRLFTDGPDDIMNADRSKPRRARPKKSAQSKHDDDDRHIGCPVWWLRLVFPVVKSKSELVVALYLFRLRTMRKSKTVSVSNTWLRDAFGIDRYTKYRALGRFAKAKLIRIRSRGSESLEIIFLR